MRFDVRFAGTVAALAAGVFRLLFFAGDAFEMGVFVETEPEVRVTGFANRAADKGAGRRLGPRRRRDEREQQY